MKKYIFILALGAGSQTVLYFSYFDKNGNIHLVETASRALVIDGVEKAREIEEQILKIHPSYSVIWCPIKSRTIDTLL